MTIRISILAIMICVLVSPCYPRDRLGILPFTGAGGLQVRNALADEIGAALARRSRFVVLERAQVQHLLSEHDLADKGYIDPEEAVESGKLLGADKAYHCYCSKERLEILREAQMKEGIKPRYDGKCLHLDSVPEGIKPVVRFRNPQGGNV